MSKTSLAFFLLSHMRSTMLSMSIFAVLMLFPEVFSELTLRFLAGAMFTDVMWRSRDLWRM